MTGMSLGRVARSTSPRTRRQLGLEDVAQIKNSVASGSAVTCVRARLHHCHNGRAEDSERGLLEHPGELADQPWAPIPAWVSYAGGAARAPPVLSDGEALRIQPHRFRRFAGAEVKPNGSPAKPLPIGSGRHGGEASGKV